MLFLSIAHGFLTPARLTRRGSGSRFAALLLAFAAAAFAGCSDSPAGPGTDEPGGGGQTEEPEPLPDYGAPAWTIVHTGERFRGVSGTDGANLYAVTDGAIVMHYDGAEWTGERPAQGTLADVWVESGTSVYVVGNTTEGPLLHYDGEIWSPEAVEGTGGPRELNGVWGDGGEVFAVGAGSAGEGVVVHRDSGSWAPMNPPAGGPLTAVWGRTAGDVWAVGHGGRTLHWDGASWTEIASGTDDLLLGVWGTDTRVYAVGYRGTILRYDGTAWSAMDGAVPYLRGIGGSGDDDILAVGDGGVALWFDGSVWREQDTGFDGHLEDVWSAGPGSQLVVGQRGAVLQRGQSVWGFLSGAASGTLSGIGGREGEVVAVGSEASFLQGDGGTWGPTALTSQDLLWAGAVHGDGAGGAWVVGYRFSAGGGAIMHFDGADWTTEGTGGGGLRDLWADSAGGVALVVGDGGTILRRTGAGWQPESSGTTEPLYGVAGAEGGALFAVGAGGVILRDSGDGWATMSDGGTGDLFDVWAVGSDAYAVGEAGTLLHYDGAWSRVSTSAVEHLFAVWGTHREDVFVVGEDGLVLRYDGASWTGTRPLPGIDLHAIWGPSPTELYAAGADGLILRGSR